MSIVKSKHASNYTVIPNDVFKQGLSIEAIGLLMYFLSLPHDWVIYKTQLHTQLNIGSDKTDRIFKELQNAGYLLSVRSQNAKGVMEWEHVVYDKPFNGEPESIHTPFFHGVDIHGVDNPILQSKEEQSKQDKVKNTKEFDDFWLLYDKKVDKPKAQAKWNKLTQQDKEKIMQYIPKYKISQPDIKFRKDPCTFLNNKSWENEIYNQSPQSNKIIFPR